ncbi:hypothetical protein TELCIR_14492 [Teladorsagia circumcincta]|uniref:SSD domain-containing protein n=1 Tax=Teladorsagia circumcincta TaxID=45464 RepID=A0A2G9U118_TELCI|nr:hypothetical protein TELCIR_14492 [Teladorsagia circumcincta]
MRSADTLGGGGGHETLLIRCITRFYGHWALFVANHAILTIVICTILTLIGTYKVITTPYVAGEFFSKGGSSISVFVLILPKDGGNVLREDVLKEAAELHLVDERESIELLMKSRKGRILIELVS